MRSSVFELVLLGMAVALSAAFGPWGALGLCISVGAGVVVLLASRSSPSGRTKKRKAAFETPSASSDTLVWTLVGAALLIRWIVAIVVEVTGAWRSLGPDSRLYMLLGEAMADAWFKEFVGPAAYAGAGDLLLYPAMNAVVSVLVGPSHLVMALLNGVVGVLAAWLLAIAAREAVGRAVFVPTFVFCGFIPSVVLWTSMNLREAWSYLLMAAALLATVRLRNRPQLRHVLLLVVSLYGMTLVRPYLVPIMLVAFGASFLLVDWRRLPVVAAIAALVFAVLSWSGTTAVFDAPLEETLSEIDHARRSLAYGSSAYGAGADTDTPFGALLYLPKGLLYFFLAPLPWTVRGFRQAVAAPEALMWGAFLAWGTWTMFRVPKATFLRVAPMTFVFALVSVGYALASGNEGTAFRHRAQAMLPFGVWVGLAWVTTRTWWQDRQRTQSRQPGTGSLLLGETASRIRQR